jgi:hypothetical protein
MGGSLSWAGHVMRFLAIAHDSFVIQPVYKALFHLCYPGPFQSHGKFVVSLTTGYNFGKVSVIFHVEILSCVSSNGCVEIIQVYTVLHTIPYVPTLSVDLLGWNNHV